MHASVGVHVCLHMKLSSAACGVGTLRCFRQRKSGRSQHQVCIICNTSISSETSLDFRTCTRGKQDASARNLPAWGWLCPSRALLVTDLPPHTSAWILACTPGGGSSCYGRRQRLGPGALADRAGLRVGQQADLELLPVGVLASQLQNQPLSPSRSEKNGFVQRSRIRSL